MISEASYRFRFYPTLEQADLLNRTFGCVRFIYNRARAAREEAWTQRKESCGFLRTNTMLTQWKKLPEMTWLNDVSSVPLQQALRHLDAAYRNFYSKKSRYPGWRKKDGKQSAEFTRSGFTYTNDSLKLAKMAEPLHIVWTRPMTCKPSTVTVIKEADDRWFVSCRILHETEELHGGGEIGIDVGINHFATLSTGEKIENPRHLMKCQKKLIKAQRSLSKKEKGSNNRRKAARKVARLHSSVKNSRNDFLHKLTIRLISENQAIYVEDLNIKGLLKTKIMSRSISDASWGEFFRQLSYKAIWYGRKVEKIDRWHPSTKACSACGVIGGNIPLNVRVWTCSDCGTSHDRDHNAAINILAAGQAVSVCGGSVSLNTPRHNQQLSMKQEPTLRSMGIIDT